MREWIADDGGIYVRLTPFMEINPYLLRIPGLNVLIRDAEGDAYTLINPAIVTRKISEIAKKKGIFTFKITSLKPLNPSNAPDAFERTALQSFETGAGEYHIMEKSGEDLFFRSMAPLLAQQSCLQCHGYQGDRVGDIRGGISIMIPATETVRQMSRNRAYLALIACGILGIFFAIIRFMSHAFIRDINAAEAKLQNMATRDFLTGLINRSEALHRLREEISRSARTGSPLTILLIDIDHFKKVNDTLGHTAGDSVLHHGQGLRSRTERLCHREQIRRRRISCHSVADRS